jgi:hypothetical protein
VAKLVQGFRRVYIQIAANYVFRLGSLLVSDHSTGAFSLVTFFPSTDELQQLERSGALQKLISLFKDFYASMPGELVAHLFVSYPFVLTLLVVIEHYRVEIVSVR